MNEEQSPEAAYAADLKEREERPTFRSPICSCRTEAASTTGLRQFVWDPECPEHRLEPPGPRKD